MEKPIMVVNGLNNQQIQLFDERIVVRSLGSERYFWLSEIASVAFEPAAGRSKKGYIQFLYAGEVAKNPLTFAGILDPTTSERSAWFGPNQQPEFERLKSVVEERTAKNRAKLREADMEEWLTLLRDGKVSVSFAIEGGRSEVVLKENEKLQMILPNMVLWEARSVRTSSGGYGGPSFRVAKGVSFRLGVFGSQSSSHDDLTEIDRGRLTLTNQRLVFTGAKRTSDIKLTRIVSVEPYKDGIGVQTSGHERTQYFLGIDPTEMVITASLNGRTIPVPFNGLLLDCMIEGLIKNQEETTKESSPKEVERGAVHGNDVPEQIRELGKLRDSGLITAEEFEKKKKELLDRM